MKDRRNRIVVALFISYNVDYKEIFLIRMMYWWYFGRFFVVVCNTKPKFVRYVHIYVSKYINVQMNFFV